MNNNLFEWWNDLSKNIEKSIEYKIEKIAINIAIEAYQQLKRLGFTQKKLAKIMGVSEAYISQIFGGKNNMTIETLVRLTDALQMDLKVSLKGFDLKENINTKDIYQDSNKEINTEDILYPTSIHENNPIIIDFLREQDYAGDETDDNDHRNLSA